MTTDKAQEERFWEKVDRTGGLDACWPWLAGKSKYGPGMFKLNGKSVQARRVAYELSFGQIKPELAIRAGRNCERTCVNPAHLEELSNSESSRRNKRSQQTPEERFWEKVERTGGAEACWPWLAGTGGGNGKATCRFNGKVSPACRVAYELTNGAIPAEMLIVNVVCHKPYCVNPDHHKALTRTEHNQHSVLMRYSHECKNGHPFTVSNGKRFCRVCRIESLENWLTRHLAELDAPTDEPSGSLPEREPVYPDIWGDRQRVIGGRVVDEKFERRFLRKVNRTGGAETCWTWVGARDHNGYGLFDILSNKEGRKRTQAHIVAYVIWVGPIPEGYVIDHFRCANKPCCNPAHLEPVPREENIRRARRRKPHCQRGHPHNQRNSYFTPDGKRQCRACKCLREIETLKRGERGDFPRKLSRDERFWAKVDQSGGPDDCWPWQGKTRDAPGYGMFADGGTSFRAHRLAWELANERPIPKGQTIDHKCRNKSCCNPDHLESVSAEENSRRAAPFRLSNGQPTEVRFWAHADTSKGPNACWLWRGDSLNIWDSEHRKMVNARHFIYQLKVGPIPRGKWIQDLCGNQHCVNYRHLTRAQGRWAQMHQKLDPNHEQLAFTLT